MVSFRTDIKPCYETGPDASSRPQHPSNQPCLRMQMRLLLRLWTYSTPCASHIPALIMFEAETAKQLHRGVLWFGSFGYVMSHPIAGRPVHTHAFSHVLVLFIYEALVTFDREVACFWTGTKRTGGSLLFLANKWISLTIYALSLVVFASFVSDKVSDFSPCHGNNSQEAEVGE